MWLIFLCLLFLIMASITILNIMKIWDMVECRMFGRTLKKKSQDLIDAYDTVMKGEKEDGI